MRVSEAACAKASPCAAKLQNTPHSSLPPPRQLKYKRMVQTAMERHGLKSLTKAKERRLAEVAEEEAEEAMALEAARMGANEQAVDPQQLAGGRACGVGGCALWARGRLGLCGGGRQQPRWSGPGAALPCSLLGVVSR